MARHMNCHHIFVESITIVNSFVIIEKQKNKKKLKKQT
jgi:hypothetical protein